MNEKRKPVEKWKRSVPKNKGNKGGGFITQNIELFPLHFWASHWSPGSALFSPKLPLHSLKRKEAWERLFRIRVDGVFVKRAGSKAQYSGYTKDEIFKMYFNGGR